MSLISESEYSETSVDTIKLRDGTRLIITDNQDVSPDALSPDSPNSVVFGMQSVITKDINEPEDVYELCESKRDEISVHIVLGYFGCDAIAKNSYGRRISISNFYGSSICVEKSLTVEYDPNKEIDETESIRELEKRINDNN